MTPRRTLAVAGALVAVLLVHPNASAAGGADRKACIAAADDGQKLRDDGKLTAAREKFIACASKSCPSVVAKECSQWLEETERDMPSVTFRARDEHGKEILDVRVLVDGKPVAESITARAVPIDPGKHEFRFDRSDGKSVSDKIVIRPAEKNHIVDLSFAPSKEDAAAPAGPEPVHGETTAPPAEPSRAFHIPLLGWIGGGVAILGLGTMAVFAVKANDEETRLRATCAPSCSDSDKSSLDTKIVLANVGLGVGIAGIAVAVVATLLENGKSKSPTGGAGVHVGVAPTRGGGSFGVSGAF